MHHRRAGGQIREIADDAFRVAAGDPTALLTGPLAEKLLLREDGEARLRQLQAPFQGSDADAQWLAARQELAPALYRDGFQVAPCQEIAQILPASGGFRG